MKLTLIFAVVIALMLSGCVALVAAGMLLQWVRETSSKLRVLEAENRQQAEELHRQRHTENTISGLEDMQAVLIRLLLEEETQSDVRRAWLQRIKAILETVRDGPRAYPVDPPSGNSHNRVRYQQTYYEERGVR